MFIKRFATFILCFAQLKIQNCMIYPMSSEASNEEHLSLNKEDAHILYISRPNTCTDVFVIKKVSITIRDKGDTTV